MLDNLKIGTKLLVIGGLLVAVPLVIVTYIAVAKAKGAVTGVGDAGLQTSAEFLATDIQHAMQQEQVIVEALSQNTSVVKAAEAVARGGVKSARPEIAAATKSLVAFDQKNKLKYHKIGGLMVMDRQGVVVVASQSDDPGRVFASHAFFQEALSGHFVFGRATVNFSGKGGNVPVAAPIYSSNGDQVVGVFMEQLDIQFIQSLIQHARMGKYGYAFLINHSGMTIAHKDQSVVMKLDILKTAGLEALGRSMVAGKTGIMSYRYGGIEKIAAFAPVAATRWSVGFTLPQSDYLAPVTGFRNLAVLVAVVAVMLALGLFFLFVRSVTVPLTKAVDFAGTVSQGDFTRRLEVKRRDEVGTLTGALNDMVARLSDTAIQIRTASFQLASSSEEISASAQQLSDGAQNQASTLEETGASIEELTASVEQVADHAQSQAASVEESSANMRQMESSVEQVSNTLTEVSESSQASMRKAEGGVEAVKKAVAAINNISESSQRIAGIINVISDIADQTNLLALNASIEAARAGEHGRGFAVVADEVSKLAERSSASTKEIDELIKESGRNVDAGVEISQAAVSAMDDIITGARKTNEMVEALAADIEQQANAIRELTKATELISEMSQSISAATEEQTTNSKQVAKSIETVNEVTQQAASAAEEMSATTEELSSLAQQMQQLVEFFRLSESVEESEPAATGAQKEAAPAPSAGSEDGAAGRWIESVIGNGNSNGNGHRPA